MTKDILAEAEELQRRRDEEGLTITALAETVGQRRETVQRKLALVRNLTPFVRAMVRGKPWASLDVLTLIAKVPAGSQRAVARSLTESAPKTAREAKASLGVAGPSYDFPRRADLLREALEARRGGLLGAEAALVVAELVSRPGLSPAALRGEGYSQKEIDDAHTWLGTLPQGLRGRIEAIASPALISWLRDTMQEHLAELHPWASDAELGEFVLLADNSREWLQMAVEAVRRPPVPYPGGPVGTFRHVLRLPRPRLKALNTLSRLRKTVYRLHPNGEVYRRSLIVAGSRRSHIPDAGEPPRLL